MSYYYPYRVPQSGWVTLSLTSRGQNDRRDFALRSNLAHRRVSCVGDKDVADAINRNSARCVESCGRSVAIVEARQAVACTRRQNAVSRYVAYPIIVSISDKDAALLINRDADR